MNTVVVLTGPTRGLGRAILDEVLHRNLPLVLVGRQLERLQSQSGIHADAFVSIEVDFAQFVRPNVVREFSARLTQALRERHCERIILVSNAGVIGPIGLVGELTDSDLMDAFAINTLAPAILGNLCTRFCADRAIKLSVINISSGAASRPIAGWSAYCASKAAARAFFEVQACEGFATVEHIDPGLLDTDMQAAIRMTDVAHFPDVERFRLAAQSGQLQDVTAKAAHIVRVMLGE